MINIRECIQKAKESEKVCEEEIFLLESLSDTEILNHKKAPFWTYYKHNFNLLVVPPFLHATTGRFISSQKDTGKKHP